MNHRDTEAHRREEPRREEERFAKETRKAGRNQQFLFLVS
jgi:hypothetical protein